MHSAADAGDDPGRRPCWTSSSPRVLDLDGTCPHRAGTSSVDDLGLVVFEARQQRPRRVRGSRERHRCSDPWLDLLPVAQVGSGQPRRVSGCVVRALVLAPLGIKIASSDSCSHVLKSQIDTKRKVSSKHVFKNLTHDFKFLFVKICGARLCS